METYIIGTIGAGILLLCFFLNQVHLLETKSTYYDAGNFIGATLLVVFAYEIGAWPFVILELVWAGLSLRDLIRDVAHVA